MASPELLPCPFCGGKADPEGWLANDGRRGPECEGCGATAESAEAWNRRSDPTGLVALINAQWRAEERLRQFESEFPNDCSSNWDEKFEVVGEAKEAIRARIAALEEETPR